MVENSNWLCALDLCHGYQQVLVVPEARIFLGAVVDDRVVVSTVLSSGSDLSPYVLTRPTGWASRYAVEKTGINIAAYLDDFPLGAESREKLE